MAAPLDDGDEMFDLIGAIVTQPAPARTHPKTSASAHPTK
ncbi:hypothetical protein BJY27_004884 [Streptomyces rapamycinicus]|uniref:Uncharacterized protein n=1 Tax=Streptomyces rapamycinicus TaxID=1226757 RepID=A0ABR6LNK1_9ACTN|nr:hypothetical protein [Streptomyces rapamycinicus]